MRMPLSISRILGTTLLMFLLIGTLQGFYSYNQAKEKTAKYQEQVKYVQELEWLNIQSVITDNYNNADMFATSIKLNIETKLLQEYPNKQQLEYDLNNPNPNALAYIIFAQEIKGKYLNNIVNDNNDPFVASKSGILSDLSLNCSKDSDGNLSITRNWEEEISMHNNPQLATQAVQAIKLQINKPIFWELNKSPNPDHIMITEMDMRSLHKVFMDEGLEGLQTYEFLKPVYIQQTEDILGIPDVNNIGMKQTNSKLIVISGFNIYDILNTYHKSAMEKYNTTLRVLNRDYNEEMRHSNLMNTFVCIILLFCIIMTAMINNYVVTIMQREDTTAESTEKPDTN